MVVRGLLATNDAFDANVLHQSGNRASSNIKAFPAHLMPDFAHAIDLEVLLKDPFNLGLELLITFGTIRQARRIGPLGHVVIESRWGNRQNPANRLDPMISTVIFYELDHRLNGRSSSAWAKYADALRRISLACFSSRFSRSKRLHLLGHLGRDAAALAGINFDLLDPFVQLSPSFLDTCLVHFPLFDFIVNRRQHAIVGVLACWVVKHLDVIEHVLPCCVACQVGPPPDPFSF